MNTNEFTDTKILDNLMIKLSKILPSGLSIGYNISGNNTLEIVDHRNNNRTCTVLAVGNKRQLINMIDFYFNFQYVIEKEKLN